MIFYAFSSHSLFDPPCWSSHDFGEDEDIEEGIYEQDINKFIIQTIQLLTFAHLDFKQLPYCLESKNISPISYIMMVRSSILDLKWLFSAP